MPENGRDLQGEREGWERDIYNYIETEQGAGD
jgi:hypothetical protein